MRYVSPLHTPPPKAFQLFINNSAKRLDVFSSTGRTCKIKYYRTRESNSNCFSVHRPTTNTSFHRRDFMELLPCSLRPQPTPPLVPSPLFLVPLLPWPQLRRGAAGGLPVPAEARQVARGAAAEPGCTFKGPVAAGARLHSCSGAAAVPTRRARQPPRQPARPPRPGPPLAPREQSPRPPPPPNFRGGQRPRGRRGPSVAARPGAAPPRDPRPSLPGDPAGSGPPRRGTGKARAPRPDAGRGTDLCPAAGRGRAELPARRARAGERHGRAELSARARLSAAEPGTAAGPPAPPRGRGRRGSRLPLARRSAPNSSSRSCGGAGKRQPPPRRLMVAAPGPPAATSRAPPALSTPAQPPLAPSAAAAAPGLGARSPLRPAQARPRRRSPAGAAPAPLPPAPNHFANFRRGRGGPGAAAPQRDSHRNPPPVPGAVVRYRGESPGLAPLPRPLSTLAAGAVPTLRAGKPFLKRPGARGSRCQCPKSRSSAEEHRSGLSAALPQGCPVSSGG